RDASNDAMLRVEPVGQAQLEPLAPDVEAGGQRLQGQGEQENVALLAGEYLDLVAFVSVGRRPARPHLERNVGYMPLAEFDERGDQELTKSDDEVHQIGLDLPRIDGLQR